MNDKESPPASRLPRWAGVGAVLLLIAIIIGGLAWLHGGPQPAAAPLIADRVVHANAVSGGRASVRADTPRTSGAAKTVDICGIGKVEFDASDPSAAGRFLREYTDKTWRRWLAALRDSDDLRARATGLFLEGKLTESGLPQPMADQTRDALVQLAAGARDPAVYAMAVSACNTYSDPAPTGSCRQITLNTWARLDTGNAMPWLLIAGAAHARNDAAGEAAAFGQAVKAHKVDAYDYSLYAYSESELPNDATPLERWYFATLLIGIDSAAWSPQYGITLKHCSVDAMQDDGVRQECGALAELLVGKGTNLLDLGLGRTIGARVGWSKTRVAGLAEQRDAIMQASMQATPSDNDDLWTCEGARRGNAYVAEWVRLGELGADRELIDRSGETVPELAQKWRDFMERIQREAQRNAAAAP